MKKHSAVNKMNFLFLAAVIFIMAGCTPKTKTGIDLTVKLWGYAENNPVYLYSLENNNGMKVNITNYGAIITSVIVPDREGTFSDVVMGFDSLDKYINDTHYFGATVGRFANRIRKGQFIIDSDTFQLTRNRGIHTIHGGEAGFHKKVWKSAEIIHESGTGVELKYTSPDGEEGFPGNLDVTVKYILTQDNSIDIYYEALTDKPTHVNLTNHSYFNLNGFMDNIYSHIINMEADYYTEIDDEIIPTGIIGSVLNTEKDITQPVLIGKNIHKLKNGGYHFCYVFNKPLNEYAKVIDVYDPMSGRKMEVLTTQPGVQFYTGNGILEIKGKQGILYGPHKAFCLETQHFPDTPNHSNFPSSLLRPGEKYSHRVTYRFMVEK